MKIRGILFDKDGTLFRYSETWDTWCGIVLEKLSNGDGALLNSLARAVDFDIQSQMIKPQSMVISCTTREVAECLAPMLTNWSLGAIEKFLNEQVNNLPLAEVTSLKPFFSELRSRGLKIGVMTNDSEDNAMAQLVSANLNPLDDLDFVAGYDSGYGAKPGPDPLLAFAKAVELAPSEVVMVGDSLHDLTAGLRAGMKTIGVLTGPATQADLSPVADIVLPDISHILTFLHNSVE